MDHYRVYQINDQWEDHSWEDWFEVSIAAFEDDAPSLNRADYDYVWIIPIASYRNFWIGNDGAQGFRHRATGWTFPNWCRQSGGCPEIRQRSRRRQLSISNDSPVLRYICHHD